MIPVSKFFRAEKIMMIATDAWATYDSDEEDGDDHATPFEERVTIAEDCCSHLISIQTKAAREMEEKAHTKKSAVEA